MSNKRREEKKQRQKVKVACTHCRASKESCSFLWPCLRCVRLNLAESCTFPIRDQHRKHELWSSDDFFLRNFHYRLSNRDKLVLSQIHNIEEEKDNEEETPHSHHNVENEKTVLPKVNEELKPLTENPSETGKRNIVTTPVDLEGVLSRCKNISNISNISMFRGSIRTDSTNSSSSENSLKHFKNLSNDSLTHLTRIYNNITKTGDAFRSSLVKTEIPSKFREERKPMMEIQEKEISNEAQIREFKEELVVANPINGSGSAGDYAENFDFLLDFNDSGLLDTDCLIFEEGVASVETSLLQQLLYDN